MNIVELLSILIPTSVHKPHREVLEDSPGCGKLGDLQKRECFWGCQWEENPYYKISQLDATIAASDLLEQRLEQLSKIDKFTI